MFWKNLSHDSLCYNIFPAKHQNVSLLKLNKIYFDAFVNKVDF